MLKVKNTSAGISTEDVLQCTNADQIAAWVNIIDFDLTSIRLSIELKEKQDKDTSKAESAYKLQLALRTQCLTRLRQLSTMPDSAGVSLLDKVDALTKRVSELESIVEYLMKNEG